MTADAIKALYGRFDALPHDDREALIWRTFGGMEWEAAQAATLSAHTQNRWTTPGAAESSDASGECVCADHLSSPNR